MNIEKLLLAILLSLLVLLLICVIGIILAACITHFLSMGQYYGLVAIIAVFILFVYLVHYFYKNAK